MSFKIILANGYRYYCGLSLPWYVSKSMVNASLRDQGFVEIEWHERGATPLPVNVKPKEICKAYDDDWDLWVMATYTGKSGDGELPAKPAWIMYAKRGVPFTPKPTPDKPTAPSGDGKSGTASNVLTILGIVAGLLTIRKLVK